MPKKEANNATNHTMKVLVFGNLEACILHGQSSSVQLALNLLVSLYYVSKDQSSLIASCLNATLNALELGNVAPTSIRGFFLSWR